MKAIDFVLLYVDNGTLNNVIDVRLVSDKVNAVKF